jgi:uncharacterized membrane protein YtjA (UPF0391 family)
MHDPERFGTAIADAYVQRCSKIQINKGSSPACTASTLRHVGGDTHCPKNREKGRCDMLSWALTFLVIALIAAALGFSGVAGTATNIAYILFVVFLVLFLVSLIAPRFRGPVA